MLVNKYETSLYSWDFSNWKFLDWEITVKTKEEVENINDRFLKEWKIELFENIEKYVVNTISNKKTTVIFNTDDREDHLFWKWFIVKEKSWYKTYSWLDITES